jgi:hypothetical protein
VYIEDMSRVARQDSEWSKDVVHKTKRFEEIVIEIIEKGRRSGSLKRQLSPELAALGLFGMVNWTYRWYRPNSKYTPEDIADAFSTVFLQGAAAK